MNLSSLLLKTSELLTIKGNAPINRSKIFRDVKRIVVKIGSSSITAPNFDIDIGKVNDLVDELATVRNSGVEVILVTSGAISAGMGRLNMKTRYKDMPTLQASAAVGQNILMHAYESRFQVHNLPIAQILLTQDDFSDRKRYTNASNTILRLLRFGVVPIVNENDTISVDEIKIGDNDTLSAMVTNLAEAALLLILSDTDGFYKADPHTNPDAEFIKVVSEITDELKKSAGNAGTVSGTGGMVTKINAAEIVTGSGEYMVLANSSEENVVQRVLQGENLGTLFLPQRERMSSRRRWIAYSLPSTGALKVDKGAKHALLHNGSSLLASGLIDVIGDFEFGDAVKCIDESGEEFARGLTNYNADETRKIIGKQTSEIEDILGYHYYDEVIHRDNLVVF